jgi:predicted metal-dependent phosphoesterase TrpH
MLKFARNKLITVTLKDASTLMVHGVLEDDIYGLEVDAQVRLPDLTFLSVIGKWNRYTTPECPRALEFIREAQGLVIDSEIEQQLQKTVGRKGCRHYATLLIECCKTVRETVTVLNWNAARQDHCDLSFEDFIHDTSRQPAKAGPRVETPPGRPGHKPVAAAEKHAPRLQIEPTRSPVLNPSSEGFVIDLHTHTFPASACGSHSVDEVIEEARRIGLDGICLTDHNFTWSADQLEALRQKHGFLVLGGNEVTTDQGHMLVFGLDKDPGGNGLVKLVDLSQAVGKLGGFMIVSHPFRGFLTFGVDQLGLTVEKACERPLFKLVQGVEVLNGMVTEAENRFANQVCRSLGLASTGGSDAHTLSKIGCYATAFKSPIHTEPELVAALKAGDFQPVVFRQSPAGQPR